MRSRFLAGLHHSTPNAALLTAGSLPEKLSAFNSEGVRVPLGNADRQRLEVSRGYAHRLGGISIAALSCDLDSLPPPSTWEEVTESVTRTYGNHIEEQYDAAQASYAERQEMYEMKDVALVGVAQMIAYQEVVPRVAARSGDSYTDQELSELVRRSKPFIMHNAAMDKRIDVSLAYALALRKPNAYADYRTSGLRFNPKWFRVDERGFVVLDEGLSQNLRNRKGRPPGRWIPENDISYGCAAHQHISTVYDGSAQLADSGGLIAAAYQDELAASAV